MHTHTHTSDVLPLIVKSIKLKEKLKVKKKYVAEIIFQRAESDVWVRVERKEAYGVEH